MSLTLFNGSTLGQRPTGLGVVARDLVAALNPGRISARSARSIGWLRNLASLQTVFGISG